MSESEQPSKLLPVDDSVIIKLPERQVISNGNNAICDGVKYLYSSTKEITDKIANTFFGNLHPQQLLQDGIKAEILEPKKDWVTGRIRLRLMVEFFPDEQENNKTPGSTDAVLGGQ